MTAHITLEDDDGEAFPAVELPDTKTGQLRFGAVRDLHKDDAWVAAWEEGCLQIPDSLTLAEDDEILDFRLMRIGNPSGHGLDGDGYMDVVLYAAVKYRDGMSSMPAWTALSLLSLTHYPRLNEQLVRFVSDRTAVAIPVLLPMVHYTAEPRLVKGGIMSTTWYVHADGCRHARCGYRVKKGTADHVHAVIGNADGLKAINTVTCTVPVRADSSVGHVLDHFLYNLDAA